MKSAINNTKESSRSAISNGLPNLWPIENIDLDNEDEEMDDDVLSDNELEQCFADDEVFEDCVHSDDEAEKLNDAYGDDTK